MAINFPASLDSLTNPTSSDSLNSPSHSGQHADANDAIEALQAKVGVDGSAVTTSLDYKASDLDSRVTAIEEVSSSSQTGTTYTLALSDAGTLINLANASPFTLTVPGNSTVPFPIGTQILLYQGSTGQATVAAASGVTIRSEGSKFKLKDQYAVACLYKLLTNTWILFGNLDT